METSSSNDNGFSVVSLETDVEFPDLAKAPDVPLLVQIVGIKPVEMEAVAQRFGIDLEDLRDLQDPDERPRLQLDGKFTMLVLRAPARLDIKDRKNSTFPIGLFTNGRDVVILQNDKLPLRKERLRLQLRTCTSPVEIVYRLWEIIIYSFETALDLIESTINNLEDSIMTEIYPFQLDMLFQLSRDAIFLEAALKTNMKVMRQLRRTPVLGGLVLDSDRLEELDVDLQQQTELSAIYRELIDNTMNGYDTFVTHDVNRAIKTLTSVSLLAMIPTLIASIYGMNVELPFQNQPYAFLFVVGISMCTTIPLLLFLRRRGLV